MSLAQMERVAWSRSKAGGGWLALPGESGAGVKHFQVRAASTKKGNPWKGSVRLANSHGQHAGRTPRKRGWRLCLPPVRCLLCRSAVWSHCLQAVVPCDNKPEATKPQHQQDGVAVQPDVWGLLETARSGQCHWDKRAAWVRDPPCWYLQNWITIHSW